jgi:hypothetical protein
VGQLEDQLNNYGRVLAPHRRNAVTVLDVLGERGRRGLPRDELCRQLSSLQLYLLASWRIYANDGAMTPGVTGETADGMSLGKIGRIIDALRCERYRFSPARRVYIPNKSGRMRPIAQGPASSRCGDAATCGRAWTLSAAPRAADGGRCRQAGATGSTLASAMGQR